MEALSITGTIALLKEAGSALQAAGKIELWNKVVALQAQLIDMQLEAQNKDEKLKLLSNEVSSLQEKLKFAGNLTFQGYWYSADGDPYSFCMTCWETKKLAVHLQDVGEVMGGYRKDCLTCKNTFVDRGASSSRSSFGSLRVVRS
jgi:hypothetical protein